MHRKIACFLFVGTASAWGCAEVRVASSGDDLGATGGSGSSVASGSSSTGGHEGGEGGSGGARETDAVVVTASLDGAMRVSCDDGLSWGPPTALKDGHPTEDFVGSFPWVRGLSRDDDAWLVAYGAWREDLMPTPTSPNWVRRSDDLVHWDPPVRLASGPLVGLVRGADHFLAVVGTPNTLWRSIDGETWSEVPLPLDEVGALRVVPETRRLVVVGASAGIGAIVLSDDDGLSFRAPSVIPPTCAIAASSFVSEGARTMIVVTGEVSCVTSDGGDSWSLGGSTPPFTSSVAEVLGQLIGWGDVDAYTSADGITWTKRSTGVVPVSPTAVGVSEAGRFVAMDFLTFRAMHSVDGVAWKVLDVDIGHAAFTQFGEAPAETACGSDATRR